MNLWIQHWDDGTTTILAAVNAESAVEILKQNFEGIVDTTTLSQWNDENEFFVTFGRADSDDEKDLWLSTEDQMSDDLAVVLAENEDES